MQLNKTISRMRDFVVIILFLLCITIISCYEGLTLADIDHLNDRIPPVITIESPRDGDLYLDNVDIQGIVTDDQNGHIGTESIVEFTYSVSGTTITPINNKKIRINADGSFQESFSALYYTGMITILLRAEDISGFVTIKELSLYESTLTPPDAIDDYSVTEEDTAVTINVLENDINIYGNTLVIESVSDPLNGTAIISGETVVYIPDPDYNGEDEFFYTASNGEIDEAKVTVIITSVIDTPSIPNIQVTTGEDTSVTINIIEYIINPDNIPFSLDSVGMAQNGIASIMDGYILYLPDANFNGSDSFPFTIIIDNSETMSATILVLVNWINDAPVAANDSVSSNEDTLVIIDVLANDTDIDGDDLNIASVGMPYCGIALINAGCIVYTPDPDFNGIDSFTYTITDGNGGSDTAVVSVTICSTNDTPVAVDDYLQTNEDTMVIIDVLANDTDIDGDDLDIGSVEIPGNGTAVINEGCIEYTPNENFNGIDSFTYTITDGNGGIDTAVVSIVVISINDPPDAVDDSAQTDENTMVIIDVLANDTDVDGDDLDIENAGIPGNGTAVINEGSIEYTPNEDFNGIDSFTYTITDGNGGVDTATVYITVVPP